MLFLLLACEPDDGLLRREPFAHVADPDVFEVVPPVALPVPTRDAEIQVWMRLPEGARTRTASDGRAVLDLPPGTLADRVELRRGRVVDVRGTTLGEDGRRVHHVYKAIPRISRDHLVGASWPADDPAAAREAIDGFMAVLADHGVPRLESMRAKLDCDGCHVVDRPANRTPREHGLVARGTDGAGFFTPSTLLGDTVPVESYGLRPTDPHLVVSCADQPVAAEVQRCADGTLPLVGLDLDAALALDDPHALAFVASRDRILQSIGAHP